ncbi:hypothetical protein [Bacillus sp. REN3]|uniref:hypothetical protein n=1 Tax=Bacillus sp. REN3 TaxID=2802440 RepID=UPI001AEE8627|nr:hypothetical protein [Bacillus sp. REN3]
MKWQTPEELTNQLLSNSFIFKKALLDYVKNNCILLECEWEAGHEESLGKTIPIFLKQLCELEKLQFRKISMLSEYSNPSKLYALLLDYKEYDSGLFEETVNKLYSISQQCFLSDPARYEMKEDLNQLFRAMKEQQKLIDLYIKHENDPETVWLS